jgi:hypothetical protein
MQPRPSESSMDVSVMQNFAGARPPPMRACPSSSWPTVPFWPPDAVRPKQQFVVQGVDVTAVAKARASRVKTFMMRLVRKHHVKMGERDV